LSIKNGSANKRKNYKLDAEEEEKGESKRFRCEAEV
jgi:hypothetical protein